MNFNEHSNLVGKHAFLSASKYHWINYDIDKMTSVYDTALAAMRGTELHEFASQAIRLKQKLRASKKTVAAYVNDAIGYRMTPEQVLVYSLNAFGTADAISFHDNLLRIHDLKTGVTRASFKQLYVYAALFCLEYDYRPGEIEFEFRIYQNDNVQIEIGDPTEVARIMDKIIIFDRRIEEMRQEAMS